jgi:hypothetical protein
LVEFFYRYEDAIRVRPAYLQATAISTRNTGTCQSLYSLFLLSLPSDSQLVRAVLKIGLSFTLLAVVITLITILLDDVIVAGQAE